MRILLFLLVSFASISSVSSQDGAEDYATVYIIRTGGGPVINFKYFLEDQYIGKFNSGKHMTLKLPAGKHLLWAASENKAFAELNLEANKTYIVNSFGVMGGLKAGVKFMPVDESTKEKALIRFKKNILRTKDKTFSDAELSEGQENFKTIISAGLKRYEKIKGSNKVLIVNHAIDFDSIDTSKKKKKS